ncbi:MAG: late competence development protein ComFB [Anaerocolumna sp.]|jgi:competence protein ComFB|nr:late competence development protein ComFB [Anaerocolumna sp.]
MRYHNLMEKIVSVKLDEIWDKFEGCKCDRCRDDIIACALNNTTPKYVVSEEGELYAKAESLNADYELELVKIVSRAINAVSANPSHLLKV